MTVRFSQVPKSIEFFRMKKKKNLLKEKSRFSPTSLAVVIYKTLPRFGVKVLTPLCAILCGNKCPPEIPQYLRKNYRFSKMFFRGQKHGATNIAFLKKN